MISWINKIIIGNCFEKIDELEEGSVDLFITSPPYADMRNYGKNFNILHPDNYVDWLLPINDKIFRALKDTGSFIINIGDKVVNKQRHIFIFDYIVRSVRETKLLYYDRYIWHKPSYLPNSSEKRFNNSIEFILHFVKDVDKVKFNMDVVRKPYAKSSIIRCNSKSKTYGVDPITGLKVVIEEKFGTYNKKGKVPECVFKFYTNANNYKSKINHPAAFSPDLPDFFIKVLTDKGDLVVDPFMGSGTTAFVALRNDRNFIGFDTNEEYVKMANSRIKELVNNKLMEKFLFE
ncbi:MAG: DNA-methyltransferase [Elusimicrobiota bacterium]